MTAQSRLAAPGSTLYKESNFAKMKNSPVNKVIIIFLILSPVFLWTMYINIDSIPWFSYYAPSLSIQSEGSEVTYSISPNIMITATNLDLLEKVLDFIGGFCWDSSFSLGNVEIRTFFGTDGYSYGGIYVRGPSLAISLPLENTLPEFREYHSIKIIDIREFCADTQKAENCSYNNPFKGITNLFIGLVIYSVFCAISIIGLVIISRRINRGRNRNTQEASVE